MRKHWSKWPGRSVCDTVLRIIQGVFRFRKKNCENVGDNFSREARKIHYDNKTSKGIYGQATEEETKELLEEGIEVASIPWVNKSEN